MPGEESAATAARYLGLTAQAVGMWAKRPGAPARVDGKRVWVQWPAFARWREEELCRQRVEEATKALRAQLDAQQTGNPLMRKLEGQYPQMPQTAKMLHLSPRTYRRRLAREQRSYQELLDQVRAEHATRYLQNTRLPLSSIAYLIGFNDASNFRRAYQKWTGRSPADVRDGH